MAVEAALPKIGAVLVTAAVDSINPCAIGVLILLVSVMSVIHSKKKMLTYGFLYVVAVYITYLLAGIGLLYFLSFIPLAIAQYISIAVAVIVIGAGLIEIKDYFWYGQGISLSIPSERAKQIHEMTKKVTLPGVILLGIFVAAVELPCTGAPYLAIILLLSQNFNIAAFFLLLLYNLIFIVPLIIILLLVAGGMKIQALKRWKQKSRAGMRLAIGTILVILGWLLISIASGIINLA